MIVKKHFSGITYYLFSKNFSLLLFFDFSSPSKWGIWVRCHWPGWEMDQGWVCLRGWKYMTVNLKRVQDVVWIVVVIPALFSQVLLVLTTFQVPLFMMRFGQSNLYRRWGMPDGWWHTRQKWSSTLFVIAVVWGSNCNFVTVSVKTMGRRSKMWLTWSTTHSSRLSLASPSALTTLARWAVSGKQKRVILSYFKCWRCRPFPHRPRLYLSLGTVVCFVVCLYKSTYHCLIITQ